VEEEVRRTECVQHEASTELDEASSVVWGMPGFVVRAGLADSVCDLRSVVPEILRRV